MIWEIGTETGLGRLKESTRLLEELPMVNTELGLNWVGRFKGDWRVMGAMLVMTMSV